MKNTFHMGLMAVNIALGSCFLLSSLVHATVPAKPVAKAVPADKPLTADQLRIASYIATGRMPCELGAFVNVLADPKSPGYFNVQTNAQRFRMVPVVSVTGAARLEDTKAGAVWLQLTNKSMLMNQKLGQRLADECKSPAQVAAAEAMKLNPAPSVLDNPAAPVASGAPAETTVSVSQPTATASGK